jgi:hypothetical protein
LDGAARCDDVRLWRPSPVRPLRRRNSRSSAQSSQTRTLDRAAR